MKKKILIVAPVPCYPAHKGNSARIASIYECLVNMGFDVYYLHLPDSPFNAGAMVNKLKEKYFYRKFHPINAVKIRLVFKALKTFLSGTRFRKIKVDDFLVPGDIAFYKAIFKQVQPDVVWINYAYYSKLLNHTPGNTLKILDTHDSIYLRSNNIFTHKRGYKNLKIDLADEITCVNRADEVICIQPAEAAFFKANGCNKNLSTIGYIHAFTPTTIRDDKNTLLFMANEYFIYKDAITAFINDAWPQLKAKRPGIRLLIAGKICGLLNQDLLDADITLLGVVDDLKDLYDGIDIAINPVKPGSGLKIKAIECLCFGKPVVTTPSGKDGLMEFENKGLIIADTPAEWIHHITRLLSDKDHYNSQILDLRNNIERYNDGNITILEKLFQAHI